MKAFFFSRPISEFFLNLNYFSSTHPHETGNQLKRPKWLYFYCTISFLVSQVLQFWSLWATAGSKLVQPLRWCRSGSKIISQLYHLVGYTYKCYLLTLGSTFGKALSDKWTCNVTQEAYWYLPNRGSSFWSDLPAEKRFRPKRLNLLPSFQETEITAL